MLIGHKPRKLKRIIDMKILVVDDERAIRNSLKEILSDEGYNVDVAEDGATAIDMAEKERYDVIFCDIKMPNMEGTEVLEKLRTDGVDSAIIMISGHGDIDTAVECIKKGAFDFIQKQCAAVSLLELALMLFDGGGESSLFVPKQFTFNEFGRNGCAVYLNVRHCAPVALLVKASGHEFLS